MNKNEKDKLYTRFINGESIQDIADSIGKNWSYTYQIIGNRLPRNIKLSIEEKESIKQMYLSGISCTKIGEIFRINHKLVAEILDEFNIDRKHNGVRKYTLNENYFRKIDTPNKAYILGLLYADGYNNLDKKSVRLQLREDDYEILERINKEIGSNHPIKLIDCSHRVYGDGYTSKNMYSLDFYGSAICDDLDKVGVHQNKSLSLEYPDFLDEKLHSHFIRGYFDGDGSIYSWTKRFQVVFTITSTEKFCNRCLDIIRSNVRVGGSIYDASCHNGITKVISIGGNDQCKRVLDWLYEDASLFIKRKHDRYLQYFYPYAA